MKMKGTGLMGGRANTYWAGPNIGLYPFYMAIYIYIKSTIEKLSLVSTEQKSPRLLNFLEAS